jgi:hypothetical protein
MKLPSLAHGVARKEVGHHSPSFAIRTILIIIPDGPALRANALITWANFLLGQGNTSYVTNTLWPIIKLDLGYVMNNWNQSTYALFCRFFVPS